MKYLLLVAFAATVLAQTADLAVINANIYTVNPKQPRARALAVRNGKLLSVGDDISTLIAGATRVIDAKGATVIPGLIDSHGHVRSLGDALENLDLRGLKSEKEIAERVRQAASRHKPGEWILGRAWDQNLWTAKQFPTERSLSEAAPLNPVALTRVDGHALWVNRKAMDLSDINAATPDPAGGKILNGVLLDRAQALVSRRIPEPSAAEVQRRITLALRECARLGLTTVHDAGIGAADIEAYRSLVRAGQMPVRVYAMISGSQAPLLESWLQRGPETGDYLTIRAIKLVADGALGSRGAAMLEPYTDDLGNRGLLILNREFIQGVAQKALARGFQVNTHAIGDAANRAALDAYAAALKGPNTKRFRIEHAQIVAPEDFRKFSQYSIIASMQPTHAVSDMSWAPARVGPERIKGAYAWRTFLNLGVHLASGSDFPVENPNPIPGFYAAINGPIPSQRLTREEALRSWTMEGAYAAFEENVKGSLEPGKLADFVMLSNDPMSNDPVKDASTRVTLTVVGGKIVFQQ